MESVDSDIVHEEVLFTLEETTPHHKQEVLHGFTIPITLPAKVPVFMHIGCSMYHTAKPLLYISVISRYFLFFCRLLF
jgi:hypothetical protein